MADSKSRIYGIDLGTTYSCIAYVDEHGKPTIVPNKEGQATTPSVVFFESPSNIVVGQHAKDVAELYPDRVVSTVKRVMGDPDWVFEYDGKTYRPQTISSYILRKLVSDAESVTSDKITDVVITCPAYFGVTQKEATRQAGELAGLNVRYVIPEPVAAAIAYGIEQTEDQTVLVFDLGGGTFDVTLIDIRKDALTVTHTGGDHLLGGKNWDEVIATWFAEQFSNETGTPADKLTSDRETWQELMNAAEAGKVTLSSRLSYEQKIRFDVDRTVAKLAREKFEELTQHLLERTISLTKDLLETAKAAGHTRVDKLLLVGGSTYMPQVIAAARANFPFEIMQFDPNQAVAKGAALFGFKCFLDEQIKVLIANATGKDAANIDVDKTPESIRAKAEEKLAAQLGHALPDLRNLTRRTVTNVTSKSFGIMVIDRDTEKDRVCNLVVVNESVPRTVTREFVTHRDNQEGVMLRCMENTERAGPNDPSIPPDTSTEVGTAELRFTRRLPKNSPIEVGFSLAADGLLKVHGKDLTTYQEIHAQFRTAAIMTKEEIEEQKERDRGISVT